ncbi:serine protease family S33 [Thraustotheca clavata]|uniref:Serine protease family S33 n=1 Tax=Thraustotheca clavata TaxID=74557 RepID=A0A1W0A5V9_9STRA|nr:serine protease family S33 [Thraustotheca clavata]
MAMRLALLATLIAVIDGLTIPLNGWYDCSIRTFGTKAPSSSSSSSYSSLKTSFGDDGRLLQSLLQPVNVKYIAEAAATAASKSSATVECAELTLPLCYSELCTAPANISNTIPVFVKRIRAQKRTSSTKSLWFLQGGPGASSVNMESLMILLYNTLGGSVDMYTMDHRGTGRSSRLSCTATQIETPGSSTQGQITNEVLPACIQDVNIQLGSANSTVLRSYSTTSAAMDLSNIISYLGNVNTYVYGVSYGTYLVERLIQLANPNIKGYALDGIVSNSGSKSNKKMVFNDWDINVNQVAQYFITLCSSDSFCNSKFPKGLNATIVQLYDSMDSNPSGTKCASILANAFGKQNPSITLRLILSTLLQDQDLRSFIPALVYRANRCNNDDALALYNFLVQYANNNNAPDTSGALDSTMLYNLVVTSEMWRTPTESQRSLTSTFEKTIIGSDVSDLVSMYCIASGGSDPNCADQLVSSSQYTLQYPRDKYYDVPITIPDGSSVFMMSGLLDPQTYYEYGRYQYDSFVGTSKRLIEFNYSAHGAIANTPVTTKNGAPCGAQLLAAFVAASGDVLSMDTSCVSKVSPMSFKLSSSDVKNFMATTDAYDGVPSEKYTLQSNFTSSAANSGSLQSDDPTTSSSSSSSWKAAAIVGFVLAGVLLIAFGFMVYRARIAKKNENKFDNYAAPEVNQANI